MPTFRPWSVAHLVPALSVAGLALAACDPIQDPWVADPEMLEKQRDRAPEMNDRLRERALMVQSDR